MFSHQWIVSRKVCEGLLVIVLKKMYLKGKKSRLSCLPMSMM